MREIRRMKIMKLQASFGWINRKAMVQITVSILKGGIGMYSRLAVLCLLISAMVPPSISIASDRFPSKPVRMILPGPPGGGADQLARILGQRLSNVFAQPVIIDNRPGAGGMLGMDLASKATSDGYTLVMGNSGPNAVIPNLYKKIPYDPVKDLAPVSLVASTINLLVIHPSVQANSVSELIRLAKAAPGRLAFASGGNGQASHLAGELFKLTAQIDILHVPYKGSGPAVVDLIGGRVAMMFANIPSSMPQVSAGKLRALAVTSAKRSKLVPEVPTMSESGLAGYESIQWYGVLAPAGVPRSVLAYLNTEIVKAVKAADMQAELAKRGFDPVGSTAGEFKDYIRSELAKWKKVVDAAGIGID